MKVELPIVFITAAGNGKRFGAITKAQNKALLKIENTPLILDIIKKFRKKGLKKIIVTTGYKNKEVSNTVGDLATCYFNPFFQISGILVSFWIVRSQLAGKPFIFTTSDHYFHLDVLKNLLTNKRGLKTIIQKKDYYQKESSKVEIQNNKIIQMGKNIPHKKASGEFTGLVFFDAKTSTLFFDEVENFLREGKVESYVMDVLKKINKKYKIPIRFSFCKEDTRIEIDTVKDLILARRIAEMPNKKRYTQI